MEIEPSKVNKIIDLVGYQEGSVVSRMLINKDSGSVTLFAFDKGQKLSEHTAPFDAFVHICVLMTGHVNYILPSFYLLVVSCLDLLHLLHV